MLPTINSCFGSVRCGPAGGEGSKFGDPALLFLFLVALALVSIADVVGLRLWRDPYALKYTGDKSSASVEETV